MPDGGDAHVDHSHVSHLGAQLFDHTWKRGNEFKFLTQGHLTSPLAILETAVCPIRLNVEFELELDLKFKKLKENKTK